MPQRHVEQFRREMERIRKMECSNRAKQDVWLAECAGFEAIKSMAKPCPFCGGSRLHYSWQTNCCIISCATCGAQRQGAGTSAFYIEPDSREARMQRLADAVTGWNYRAQEGGAA